MESNHLKLKEASVIVLHEAITDSIILTKRSEYLKHHPSEICFPGGVRENSDVDLYQTALRELKEELSIGSERVQLIRSLKTQLTLRSVIIQPWYAQIDNIEPYKFNDEVVKLLKVPISDVKNNANYQTIQVEHQGVYFESIEFVYHKSWIWGATAKIMQQLAHN